MRCSTSWNTWNFKFCGVLIPGTLISWVFHSWNTCNTNFWVSYFLEHYFLQHLHPQNTSIQGSIYLNNTIQFISSQQSQYNIIIVFNPKYLLLSHFITVTPKPPLIYTSTKPLIYFSVSFFPSHPLTHLYVSKHLYVPWNSSYLPIYPPHPMTLLPHTDTSPDTFLDPIMYLSTLFLPFSLPLYPYLSPSFLLTPHIISSSINKHLHSHFMTFLNFYHCIHILPQISITFETFYIHLHTDTCTYTHTSCTNSLNPSHHPASLGIYLPLSLLSTTTIS